MVQVEHATRMQNIPEAQMAKLESANREFLKCVALPWSVRLVELYKTARFKEGDIPASS